MNKSSIVIFILSIGGVLIISLKFFHLPHPKKSPQVVEAIPNFHPNAGIVAHTLTFAGEYLSYYNGDNPDMRAKEMAAITEIRAANNILHSNISMTFPMVPQTSIRIEDSIAALRKANDASLLIEGDAQRSLLSHDEIMQIHSHIEAALNDALQAQSLEQKTPAERVKP